LQVQRTADLAQFDAATRKFLERDPVRNTVPLTILDTLATGVGLGDADPWFAWVADGNEVIGAALRTPPYKVALAGMSVDAARALGRQVQGLDLPGAFGDLETVAAFAQAAGRGLEVHISEIQYLLTEVIPAPTVPGTARPYADSDADLYVRWNEAFIDETGVQRGGPDVVGALQDRIRAGGALWLWEVDGAPVSMCGRNIPVCAVPRIGPVWTPPLHRRRGFAAAVTAFVCADALAAGARACTLFADAANPTSNGVYERIGFRPVAETVEAEFT
jgi:predicted GNAT family acetyltransferase